MNVIFTIPWVYNSWARLNGGPQGCVNAAGKARNKIHETWDPPLCWGALVVFRKACKAFWRLTMMNACCIFMALHEWVAGMKALWFRGLISHLEMPMFHPHEVVILTLAKRWTKRILRNFSPSEKCTNIRAKVSFICGDWWVTTTDHSTVWLN